MSAAKAFENEYISRRDAIKARKHSCDKNCLECDFAIEGDSWCNGEVFVVDLLRIPAADVVKRDCFNRLLAENDELRKERPVVRCKDCICFHPIGTSRHNGDCDKHYERVQCEDFCSWAEVKQDG